MPDVDLLVIGGGAAGLTAAGLGATAGARTLLIERSKLGGDCTWTGCIPSKTLLKAAKVAWQAKHASAYGLTDLPFTPDTRAVMRHVHRVREEVYREADAPDRLEAHGIEVCAGEARFIDAHTIALEADGATDRISARYIIIAAGGRPAVPRIEGLDEVPYLTSETFFEQKELPRRLAILGAGPIGTELAQAANRLGTEVTVVNQVDRILEKDDPELAALLLSILESEGITYLHQAALRRVRRLGAEIELEVEHGGRRDFRTVDALLIAVGRVPNVEHLGLGAAGVRYTESGIAVDDRCRTNVRHIYAVGDVTGRYQLTHMSEHMAKVAATNALLRLPMKIDAAHVPWVTYTDPELAHVGATLAEIQRRKGSYGMYRFPYSKIDRAVTDGETTGWLKIYATKRTGKILGASILGEGAGDLIGEVALAMRNGITLRQISDTIHPYPTLGLGIRRAADQWYVQQYSPRLVRALQTALGYRGQVREADPGRII